MADFASGSRQPSRARLGIGLVPRSLRAEPRPDARAGRRGIAGRPGTRRLARQGFHGTAAELLQALNQRVDETLTRQRGWPQSARAMSGLIRRIAPNLRELGYTVDFTREAGTARRRIIEIHPHTGATALQTQPSRTAPPGQPPRTNGTGRTQPHTGSPTTNPRDGRPDDGDDWDDADNPRPEDAGQRATDATAPHWDLA